MPNLIPGRAPRAAALALLASLTGLAARAQSTPPPAGPQASDVTATPCPATAPASRCLFVSVPLDHADPGGKRIKVFVAVAEGDAAAPAEPLFYLAGGPGQAGSRAVKNIQAVHGNFTVVGIDQRGTGSSQPAILCPELASIFPDSRNPATQDAYEDYLRQCSRSYNEGDTPLRFFSTTQAALDVEWVRSALGYGKINLYGMSYGTRLAQEVMRRAPQHLRSVILEGVSPTSLDRFAEAPVSLHTALSAAIDLCQQQPTCMARYPDLRGEYLSVTEQLTKQPEQLGGTTMDAGRFQYLISTALYFKATLPEVPYLIHAAAQGRWNDVQQSATYPRYRAMLVLADELFYFTVQCPGEIAHTTPDRLRAAGTLPLYARLPASDDADWLPRVCRTMNLSAPAPQENDPVQFSGPVLLLGGQFDPITPVRHWPLILPGLTNVQTLIMSFSAHGDVYRTECGKAAFQSFLTDPTRPIDTSCKDEAPWEFR